MKTNLNNQSVSLDQDNNPVSGVKASIKTKDKTLFSFDELPNFIKSQFEIIESLQNRVTELNKEFEIEMKCKNQAYGFILEKGCLKDYIEYTKNVPVKY